MMDKVSSLCPNIRKGVSIPGKHNDPYCNYHNRLHLYSSFGTRIALIRNKKR